MQPARITIDTFIKELGDDHGGSSRPVVVVGSDGLSYLLKTERMPYPSPRSNTMFLNELLVSQIADYLGVLVPGCAIAYVDQQFITNAPALQFVHRYEEGWHFASEFLEQHENNLMHGYKNLMALKKPYMTRSWAAFFDGIENKEIAAGIVVLDLLTANSDRFFNEGNLLIAPNNGARNLYAIDHGHCFFGAVWNSQKITCLRQPFIQQNYPDWYIKYLFQQNLLYGAMLSGLGIMFQELQRFIDVNDPSENSFKPSIQKLRTINPQIIDHWFSAIPDEWFVDKASQMSYYKQFITKQIEMIPPILSMMALNRAFTNYRGGDLYWQDKHIGTL